MCRIGKVLQSRRQLGKPERYSKISCELCARSSSAKYMRDLVTVDSDDPLLADNKGILINAETGDLILWDSRLVHCNNPALNIPTNLSAPKAEVK